MCVNNTFPKLLHGSGTAGVELWPLDHESHVLTITPPCHMIYIKQKKKIIWFQLTAAHAHLTSTVEYLQNSSFFAALSESVRMLMPSNGTRPWWTQPVKMTAENSMLRWMTQYTSCKLLWPSSTLSEDMASRKILHMQVCRRLTHVDFVS